MSEEDIWQAAERIRKEHEAQPETKLQQKLDRLQRYRINARKAIRDLNRSICMHQEIYRKEIAVTYEQRQRLDMLERENAMLRAQLAPNAPDIKELARQAFHGARENNSLWSLRDKPRWGSFEQWWKYRGSRFLTEPMGKEE